MTSLPVDVHVVVNSAVTLGLLPYGCASSDRNQQGQSDLETLVIQLARDGDMISACFSCCRGWHMINHIYDWSSQPQEDS